MDTGSLVPQGRPGQGHDVEFNVNDLCLLYPTDILNCSWSFDTLQKDAQLFVHLSICDDDRAVHYTNISSGERVGLSSLTPHKLDALYVILHFNITLHDAWTVYTSTYDMDMLEVLPPPQNISLSVKDGDLFVKWGLPKDQVKPSCLEYQLDMGDQERPKHLIDQQSYKEPNIDPHCTYSVRLRTRKMSICHDSSQWSDWSSAIKVEPSVEKLSPLVIVLMSLGIPMILLAVLLLLRHQRVAEVLFPPIPRPPLKYKGFLEKSDTFNLFYPVPPAEPVEEITEVEDT
ncbi:granulocyte-macrophage colony-stimulating factor receptor subunit alpha-like isoform X2 [Cyclopterus lumpus]|nr:granulocyte-macrophage colony-stimulating factor receptor subunit alpha-like isoform X2 [Cyclopterus lumpus]